MDNFLALQLKTFQLHRLMAEEESEAQQDLAAFTDNRKQNGDVSAM